MSLEDKEIAEEDAYQKKGGAEKVWEEVRKSSENAGRREGGRH